jgi:hypothetical protein
MTASTNPEIIWNATSTLNTVVKKRFILSYNLPEPSEEVWGSGNGYEQRPDVMGLP